MSLGPVEILVVGFPENKFTGAIVPELQRLVSDETITVIDGLFVMKDTDGGTSFTEFDELGLGEEATALKEVVNRVEGLISDEDVMELTAELAPGSSAAILVFEHTWALALRNSIVDAGGLLIDNIRVPATVVEEILATVPETD